MRPVLLVIIALLLFPCADDMAFAGDIPARSAIVHVTVFPSGAQIVRQADIDLEAGDHVVVIKDLPGRLVGGSLRVEGEGEHSFEIGSVDMRSIFVDRPANGDAPDKSERERLEKQIERLGDESALLSSRIRAAETQRRLMEHLADLPGRTAIPPVERPAGAPGVAAMSAEDWGRIFDLMGTRMAMADDLILKYRQQRRQKNREIKRLKKRLALQPAKKERQTEIRVAIAAGAAMKARLKIKYQVREASWRPFYDARLTTGKKAGAARLRLVRRAAIRQKSGEDWKNVSLSLSTTRPQQGAQAPVLLPERLDLLVPPPLSGYVRGMARDNMPNAKGAGPAMEEEAMELARPAPMLKKRQGRSLQAHERKAGIRQYAFQAVFDIRGATTVLQTGNEKKVAISSDEIKPALLIRAVPKLDKTAYVHARFTHASGAVPLLPGAVALYRDGTFTGNGHLPLVNAGEEQELGFGADDAVRVTRAEIRRSKGKTGVFSKSKTDERRYVIRVKNLHAVPVNMEIIDQIPYSVNEKILVSLLPGTTRPSHQNLKDKRGILSWNFKLDAGGEKKINLEYTISWPADRELSR